MFLYLYLNAKLKVWSNYHPAFWSVEFFAKQFPVN